MRSRFVARLAAASESSSAGENVLRQHAHVADSRGHLYRWSLPLPTAIAEAGYMQATTEAVLTISHVARRLGLSEQGVRRLADRGVVPCQRTSSGERIFLESHIEDERRRREAAAARER